MSFNKTYIEISTTVVCCPPYFPWIWRSWYREHHFINVLLLVPRLPFALRVWFFFGIHLRNGIGVARTIQLDFLGRQPLSIGRDLDFRGIYVLVRQIAWPSQIIADMRQYISNDLANCLLLSFNVVVNEVKNQITVSPLFVLLCLVADNPESLSESDFKEVFIKVEINFALVALLT